MLNRPARGVALFIVIGIILMVTVLATVILRIMSNQARLTHHQISRIKAYYADKAAMNLAFYKLRTGTGSVVWSAPASGINYYCINGHVDAAVVCLDTVSDAAIPYNVQIAVYPQYSGLNQTIKLEIKSAYTFTPS